MCWVPLLPLCRRSNGGCRCGHDLRCRLRVRDAKNGACPFGHPPVPVAEEFHQRWDEQGADDGRVEDDPGRQPDRERLDLVTRGRREHEEGEHQDQSGDWNWWMPKWTGTVLRIPHPEPA